MDELNILGRTWQFQFTPDEWVYNEGRGLLGLTNYHTQTIQIANDVHKEKKESVLLHEIIHVISNVQGLDITEHTVELLEAGLYQFLKENNIYQIWEDLDRKDLEE